MKLDKSQLDKSNLVNQVNGLVQDSFGKGFFGSYIPKRDTDGEGWVIENRPDRLFLIAYKGGPIRSFFTSAKIAGRFVDEDPSKMKILPGYESEAMEFAKAYEEKFRDEVEISFDYHAHRIKDTEVESMHY